MASIFVHTGPQGPYYHFEDEIGLRLTQNSLDFLYILPVNRAVRYFKRRLVDRAPGQVLIDPPVFTFEQLLLKIFREQNRQLHLVGQDIFPFITEKILQDLSNRLPYIAPAGNVSSGLVRRAADILYELRRFGFTGSRFEQLQLEDRQYNPQKYSDFSSLLSALESCLGRRLADEPFAGYSAARNLKTEHLEKLCPGLKSIYITGYGLFTPAMITFIQNAAKDFTVHVKLAFSAENRNLFRHTRQAVGQLKQLGAQFPAEKPSTFLAAHLFNRRKNTAGKQDLQERIIIAGQPDIEHEVEYIAATIRRLIFTRKIKASQIGITFSDLERYVPWVRRIFPDFGLSFNLSTGLNLKQSPLIRTLLSMLKLINSGFDVTLCLNLLHSNFVTRPGALNTDLLLRVLTAYRFEHLTRNWAGKLATRMAAYRHPALADMEPELLLQQIQSLDGWLAPFYSYKSPATVLEHRSQFLRLLKQCGLLEWFKLENEVLTERQKETEFRAYNRFMKLFEKLIWALEHLYGDRPLTLKEFLKYLTNAVEKAVYNLTEWPDYGVQIMPRLEIQSIEPEILFIGGLVDGDFPRASTRDIFFNDKIRSAMGLLASEELLEQDRFIFYSLLDSTASRIYLTYPQYEEEKTLVPSTFLSELNDIVIAGRQEPDLPDEVFITYNKLWQQVGRHIEAGQWLQIPAVAELLIAYQPQNRQRLLRLIQGTRTSLSRIIAQPFGVFEGNMESVPAVTRWLKKKYGSRAWSASRLESYAFCPLSFFLADLLAISDQPRPEKEISSQERGSAVHKILYRFYSELRRKKQTAQPAGNRQLLFDLARQVLNDLPYQGFFWELEKASLLGTGEAPGLLDVFLQTDQSFIDEQGFIPTLFELSFGRTGKGEKDPASQAEPIRLVKDDRALLLSGRIDRVDINRQGQALILDYKTGRSSAGSRVKDILNGISFQLPLYMMALYYLNPGLDPVYGGYYLVKDSANCQHIHVLGDADKVSFLSAQHSAGLPNKKMLTPDGQPLTLQDVLDAGLNHALQAADALTAGKFHHTLYPDKEPCSSYCDYRRICQKNVAKMKNLSHQQTEPDDE